MGEGNRRTHAGREIWIRDFVMNRIFDRKGGKQLGGIVVKTQKDRGK